MKKGTVTKTIAFTMLLCFVATAHAQEREVVKSADSAPVEEQTVKLPVNLYDTFSFDENNFTAIRTGVYIFGPVFVTVWGVVEWGYFSGHTFQVHPSKPWGPDALDGSSDKFGHAFGGYATKRAATFFFRSTGDSRLKSNLMGAAYSEIVTLVLEFGDGLSSAYGFDPWDVVGNNAGILLGLLLDQFPALDRMFAFQWEWVPTRKFRSNFEPFTKNSDFFTDYSGQKFLFVTKLGGIPYLSLTPLRYVNIDLGYFASGYYNNDFKNNSRNVYVGLSMNFSIAFGDLLPSGYTSSTAQSFFNYYHVPLDLEVKTWNLSRVPNDDQY